jgi:hypothetical protein
VIKTSDVVALAAGLVAGLFMLGAAVVGYPWQAAGLLVMGLASLGYGLFVVTLVLSHRNEEKRTRLAVGVEGVLNVVIAGLAFATIASPEFRRAGLWLIAMLFLARWLGLRIAARWFQPQ